MLPTPSTSHVNYAHIYEPAEDSYLLLDTLSSASEVTFLSQRFPTTSPSPVVVEIGTGSGVVLAFATANARHIFQRRDIISLGVDVNALACIAARETVRTAATESSDQAGVLSGMIQADLSSSLRTGEIDVLIFNPPYVPTEELPSHWTIHSPESGKLSSDAEFQRDSHLLALSYAGGADGMETTDQFLAQLPAALSRRGVAYLLLCEQNKPDVVAERIRSWSGGWSADRVQDTGKTAGWEKLCILRICREQNNEQTLPNH